MLKWIGIGVAVLVVGACIWLYAGGPVSASLIGLDLPIFGRQMVVAHDTTFYPGNDLNAVVGALVQNQLFGDVGGLCDKGITCEGREIVKAGTQVRVIKEITLQNSSLNVTFAHVKFAEKEGWIAAKSLEQ